MFHTSGTKHGSYSVGLTVLVIAIVIVFNLVIGQIPEAYRNLDMSSTKIYEISDTTKDLLSGLNDKVDMKVLAVKKDTDDRIKTSVSYTHLTLPTKRIVEISGDAGPIKKKKKKKIADKDITKKN